MGISQPGASSALWFQSLVVKRGYRNSQLPAESMTSPLGQITQLVGGMSLILQTCHQVSSLLRTEDPTALPSRPIPSRRRLQPLAGARFLQARKSLKRQDLRRFFPPHNGVRSHVLTDVKPPHVRNQPLAQRLLKVSRVTAEIHLF